jgi:NTE family protein
MNAAVLVDGHAKGGAQGARAALENFWRRVSDGARFSPFRRGPLDVFLGRWTLDSSPLYVAMDLMSRVLSPYDVNPMGKNPLRAILAELVNFERLAQAPIKLFITATNVRTGRGHVFRNDAITPDVLLASACLPTMFQAIKIDGQPYLTAAIPQSNDYAAYPGASREIPFSSRSTRLSAEIAALGL